MSWLGLFKTLNSEDKKKEHERRNFVVLWDCQRVKNLDTDYTYTKLTAWMKYTKWDELWICHEEGMIADSISSLDTQIPHGQLYTLQERMQTTFILHVATVNNCTYNDFSTILATKENLHA